MVGTPRKQQVKNKRLIDHYIATDEEESSERLYENILDNSMRFLNRSFTEAEQITLREYSYEMHAHSLRQVDKDRDIHLLAWQINQAQATKKVGNKTVGYFKDFSEFFDYDKRIKGLTEGYKKLDPLSMLMSKANK